MHGRMELWKDEIIDALDYGLVDAWMDRQMHDGWLEGRMDDWMNLWIRGWMYDACDGYNFE